VIGVISGHDQSKEEIIMIKNTTEPLKVVSREEWLAARKQLLSKEKEFTKLRDKLNAERRRLPMVRIEKEYAFEGPEGKANLLDLFDGRRQLIVYHFMFDPNWDEGCRPVLSWSTTSAISPICAPATRRSLSSPVRR